MHWVPHKNVSISHDNEASTRLCWNVLDHDFRVLEHTPWAQNVISLKAWTSQGSYAPQHNEYYILYAKSIQKSIHMFLAYATREAPTISYLSAALTCFGSTLILSVISKTFTASTFIFPWTTNDDKSPSAIHGLFWIRLCHVLLLSQPAFLKDLRIS